MLISIHFHGVEPIFQIHEYYHLLSRVSNHEANRSWHVHWTQQDCQMFMWQAWSGGNGSWTYISIAAMTITQGEGHVWNPASLLWFRSREVMMVATAFTHTCPLLQVMMRIFLCPFTASWLSRLHYVERNVYRISHFIYIEASHICEHFKLQLQYLAFNVPKYSLLLMTDDKTTKSAICFSNKSLQYVSQFHYDWIGNKNIFKWAPVTRCFIGTISWSGLFGIHFLVSKCATFTV